jgi:TPR repeat protein
MNRDPHAIYDDEPPEEAGRLLLPLAESGSAEAQFYPGHLADEESPRQPETALRWYRKAAAGGLLEAKHWVASFLYHGMGVAQDVPAAIALFREAAASEDAASQWKLGEHLLHSPTSRAEGILWLQRSAAQGHPAATGWLAKEQAREA